jgi:putative transcriptional regulator
MTGKIQINRLRIVLAEKDVSQKELAKLVKRTPTTISRICSNDSQPTLHLLRQIAIALNVDIKDLLYSTKVK